MLNFAEVLEYSFLLYMAKCSYMSIVFIVFMHVKF